MSLPVSERLIYLIRLPFVFILFLYQDVYSLILGKKADSKITLEGRTALVTGGNRGIGRQIAKDLYERGARVIIACRKSEYANELYKEFGHNQQQQQQQDSSLHRLKVHQVNFLSLRSVQEFASLIVKQEERLDILINNVGIMGPKEKSFSDDGIEMTFHVNYLSPFLLTRQLLPLLNRTKDSRVICITSEYNLLPYNFDKDLLTKTSPKYDALLNYSLSKLALNSFVIKLANENIGKQDGQSNGTMSIFSVHPGCVKTNLVSNDASKFYQISFMLQKLIRGVSVERGARGPLYAALEPNVERLSGAYMIAGHVFKPNKMCLKPEFRDDLWEFSENLITQSLA
ncbi:retinol dehydrogenase 13-like [Brevipalpus obovatus]|uniref:retinol dehydrogenase 13-like n=1 Tax=Brevipalpus obovatus TaxID=246614 RepID=UPI003D9E4687